MTKLVYADDTRALLGACFEVYTNKGCGFFESVFQECLEIELTDRRRVALLVNFGHFPRVEYERIVI